MSFDFQLGHSCPHLTIEEEVLLGSDRMELRTRQPVASSSHIKITANDEVVIPQNGLFTRAQVTGSLSGPFRILKNEQRLTLSNRTQTVADVVLPVGPRIDTSRVAEVLDAAVRNAGVPIYVENVNGYLRVTDFSEDGLRSQVRVGGAAASAVGFIHQVRSRGRQVYPSWNFAEMEVLHTSRNLTFRYVSARFPKFDQPVRGNPVFKVTYTTMQQQCRRCQGFGIENDYRIAADREPLLVENEDLLNQGVLKILSTIKGSNPYHPEYGTLLLTRIGTKALGSGITSINEDVVNALVIFQRLQTLQGQYQNVAPRERLASLISVNTTPSEIDPTVFEVEIVAANAANVPVVINTVYAAPGTAALAGSNGLSLGLEGLGLDPRTRYLPGTAVK
jgi:phage baseplate assembly protein W